MSRKRKVHYLPDWMFYVVACGKEADKLGKSRVTRDIRQCTCDECMERNDEIWSACGTTAEIKYKVEKEMKR